MTLNLFIPIDGNIGNQLPQVVYYASVIDWSDEWFIHRINPSNGCGYYVFNDDSEVW